ncbi:MAG: 16S rRNA (cytidine(1402)-2'-O)-methyltransferase [Clostridiales bacterium]|nr:16S rRNA (cytidine(1402)-2'-O)-methyltransferase [Clostridiales bacterium]
MADAGILYITATPIGNLEDVTLRALRVLKEVDFIAAEDTRRTRALLTAYGIKRRLVSYHEHNKEKSGREILSELKSGKSAALVTDAGLPAISDPGSDLARLCREEGVTVTVLPGACAFTAAAALSGLDTRKIAFYGFLTEERLKAETESLRAETGLIALYEAPHRLAKTLAALFGILGDRSVFIARELTKLHENAEMTALSAAAAYYSENAPKGEFALIIEGRAETPENWENLTIREHVSLYEAQGYSAKDAMKLAARERGLPKSEVYRRLLPEDNL